MRISASIAIMALAATAAAQSPLVTLSGGTNEGNVGNNIFFDLQVNQTVTISRIDFRNGANTVASSNGGLEIWLGPTTYVNNTLNAALWTPVAMINGITVAPSTVATANLPTPIALGPGNYGVALRSINCNHAYTNGTGTATPGSGSNQTFSTAEMVLRAGANQNTPWTTGLNTPRVFNGAIYYTPGGNPIVVAAWEKYGQGCYRWFNGFYETYLNPSTSFDLKNTVATTNSLHLTFLGNGYQVGPFVNGTGTYFTPTGAATNLMLGNQATATFTTPFQVLYPSPSGPKTTNSLEVSDNGYVSPVTGNGSIAVPSSALFLAGLARWALAWFDFDPSLGGQINWEADPSGNQFYVTWVNVPDLAAPTTANTMQIMFARSGDVEFRWRAMSLNIGGVNPALVGWTTGSPAQDPGDIDISALTTTFRTGPTDNPPLTLALQSRPRLGTTIGITTSNIPPSTPAGALLIGAQQLSPGQPLDFIGAPGCFLFLNIGTAVQVTFPVAGSSVQLNVPIPNDPTVNGALLYGQSVTITPGYNALGALSSNGVRMLIGSL